MRVILFLSLLVVFHVSTASVDKFLFHFKLSCNFPYYPVYQYEIRFLEEDTITSSEWITSQLTVQMRQGVSEKRMEGVQDDGDELFSAGYNVNAFIYHNCTKSGGSPSTYLRLHINQLCTIGLSCKIYFQEDLTNREGDYWINAQVTQF